MNFKTILAVFTIPVIFIEFCLAAPNPYTAGNRTQLVPPSSTASISQDVNNSIVVTAPILIINADGVFLSSQTLTGLQALAPKADGQIMWCADCTATPLAISTGTGTGAWVGVSTTTLK